MWSMDVHFNRDKPATYEVKPCHQVLSFRWLSFLSKETLLFLSAGLRFLCHHQSNHRWKIPSPVARTHLSPSRTVPAPWLPHSVKVPSVRMCSHRRNPQQLRERCAHPTPWIEQGQKTPKQGSKFLKFGTGFLIDWLIDLEVIWNTNNHQ